MVGAGEFEQFDGRAVFGYERDADAIGAAIRRNQDFAASKVGSLLDCRLELRPEKRGRERPTLSKTKVETVGHPQFSPQR